MDNKLTALKKKPAPRKSHVELNVKLAYAEALVELLFEQRITGAAFRWHTQFYVRPQLKA